MMDSTFSRSVVGGRTIEIRTAELPGDPNIPSEDRIFTTPNACVVLDGATQHVPLERSGGWLAEEVGQRLQARLVADPLADLAELLDSVATEVIDVFELQAGTAPSTTVNIVRVSEHHVDVLVLCDSPVIVLDVDGLVHEVRDDRIAECVKRAQLDVSVDIETLRNSSEGFWCVSAEPSVAHQAITTRLPIDRVRSVLAMTDGVSCGIDHYRSPECWRDAFELGGTPMNLVRMVVMAELSDPSCSRWHRHKRHDDKALVSISLD